MYVCNKLDFATNNTLFHVNCIVSLHVIYVLYVIKNILHVKLQLWMHFAKQPKHQQSLRIIKKLTNKPMGDAQMSLTGNSQRLQHSHKLTMTIENEFTTDDVITMR